MRSMKGEVVLNIPAEKAWEMYRDNEVINKINPEMLAGAEYIQGDGSPGSLRLFKLGPGVYIYIHIYDCMQVTLSRCICTPFFAFLISYSYTYPIRPKNENYLKFNAGLLFLDFLGNVVFFICWTFISNIEKCFMTLVQRSSHIWGKNT